MRFARSLCNMGNHKRKMVERLLYEKNKHHIIQTESEGYIMNETTIRKYNSATDYIGYALYAFGGLGIEVLLMMIETNIYGQSSSEWSTLEHIVHWLLTCLIWGSLGLVLLKHLPKIYKKNIEKKNIALAVVMIIISIIYTSIVWQGFKPIVELSNLGFGKFFIQYIYYAFESLLMMLIIAHGQKAFEIWFHKFDFIPFGGILLAVTWGLIHILTQGSSTGLYAVIQAFLYGSVYLALNKDYKISYIAIALMFMI